MMIITKLTAQSFTSNEIRVGDTTVNCNQRGKTALSSIKYFEAMKHFNIGIIATFFLSAILQFNDIQAQITFNCVNSPSCAPLVINGAPDFLLPDKTLSVTRGIADASIAFDPDSNKLYLTYTFITSNVTPTANPNTFIKDPSASIQLASSADRGLTWNFEKVLRQSSSEINPTTGLDGFSGFEVSSIEKGDSVWYFAYLRYHDPVGNGNNRVNSSFYIGIAKSTSIYDLDLSAEVKLAGNFADTAWFDFNLSKANKECSECDLWLDPELFYKDGKLYLLATCEPYENGIRITDSTFYGVFEISLEDNTFGKPRWIGKIATAADAIAFGGAELSKADLTYAADSSLLLVVAPVFKRSGIEEYPGAYVFNVLSVKNPQLLRDTNNIPVVSAIITSSDSEPSSGSAAYHALSNTGMILTRREMFPTQGRLEWSLHQTGIHPQAVTSVEISDPDFQPKNFYLFQNHPNPFNPSTTIRFSLPKNEYVQLKVFNMLGQEIAKLVDGELNSGEHTVVFNANDLSSGIYFYRLTTDTFSQTKAMGVVK